MNSEAKWTITVRADFVDAFARATGDRSSLHMDPGFARRTRFRQPIIHGLLPVWWLLYRWMGQQRHARFRLSRIACQFIEPAYAGDLLVADIETKEQAAASVSLAFVVKRPADDTVITTGEAAFVRIEPEAHGANTPALSLLTGPAKENSLLIADLKVGQTEELVFVAAPAAIAALIALHPEVAESERGHSVPQDTNLLATLVASAVIGMRLPGRHAIFTDFEADFSGMAPSDRESRLSARVEKIYMAGSRVQLRLVWTSAGTEFGQGKAMSLVGSEWPTGITCAELKGSHMRSGLAGRVALVTGASRGIGEATAKLLAMHGAKVIVHYHLGEADAQAIAKDVRVNGGSAVALKADLRDEVAIRALFDRIRATTGPVDILVNNAVGRFTPKPLVELKTSDYLEELRISLFAPHLCCQLAVPHMRKQRWGKIVNIGTVATEAPPPSQTAYVAAKSSLLGFTRSLAAELAGDNIHVNMVVPGMTLTSLLAPLPRAIVDRMASESVDGSLLRPVDVAMVVAFLASDYASCISGQRFVLNRGESPYL